MCFLHILSPPKLLLAFLFPPKLQLTSPIFPFFSAFESQFIDNFPYNSLFHSQVLRNAVDFEVHLFLYRICIH